MKKEQGITIISLVITIIVLIILAGISINLILGKDGIISKAKEAKEQQDISQIKEKLQLEIASAQTDAIIRGEKLEKTQLSDIVSKYGVLQEDEDTIITINGNYEISLKEVWYGVLSNSGSYTDKVEQIEVLEKELSELKTEYEELQSINSGNSTVLEDLRNQITQLELQVTNLNTSLSEEQNKFSEFKKAVAAAITEMGVETSEETDVGIIASNIKNIEGSTKGTLLGGVYQGNQTLDFSSVSDYQSLTANNFIIEIVGIAGGTIGGRDNNDEHSTAQANISTTNISKSYDNTTGKLTVSGANVYVTATMENGKVTVGTGNIYQKYNVWLVK